MKYWPDGDFPKRRAAVAALLVLVAFLFGYMIRGPGSPEDGKPIGAGTAMENHETDHETLYACPMGHLPPQRPPGRCPVCGMELVAIEKLEEQAESAPRVTLSRESQELAKVETAIAERRSVATEIKALGQVVWNPPLPLMVKLFMYESDLPWIRDGERVSFKTDASPGEVFEGTVVFRGIVSDPFTRTFAVGVDVRGDHNLLMPGMIVYATIFPFPAADGTVSSGPLPRERAPLVIPASGPLITGKRAVVYVQVPDRQGVYEGREIVLGPKAGDWYIVRAGLTEGEQVVVKGNFKIDGELQIPARRSMMNPVAASPAAGGPGRTEETSLWTPSVQAVPVNTTGGAAPDSAGTATQR